MTKSPLSSFSIITQGKTTFYVRNKFKDVLLNLDIDSLRKEAFQKGNVCSGREPHAIIPLFPSLSKGDAGGLPELANERVIIRHSRHGGFFRHIAGDIFWKGNRFVSELIASETAIEKGVNTAEIIALIKHKVFGPFYRFDVLSKEISNSLDLVGLLTNPTCRDILQHAPTRKNIIEMVAKTIRRMHDAGLYHSDLHLKNILIQHRSDNEFKAYVIDMDKAKKMNAVNTKLRMRNLRRLDRSVEKLKAVNFFEKKVPQKTSRYLGKHTQVLFPGKTDKLRFLMAYIGGDMEMKQYIKMPTKTYWIHRLFWRTG